MAKTNFERLRVYQLSEILADQVWSIVAKWNVLARDTVGKQLIRAADSIGANIAEGSGRGTFVDKPPLCQNSERISERNATLVAPSIQTESAQRSRYSAT